MRSQHPEFADWSTDDLRPVEKMSHEYLTPPVRDVTHMSGGDLKKVRSTTLQKSYPLWSHLLAAGGRDPSALLGMISDLVNGDKVYCFAGIKHFAGRQEVNRRSVTRWLSDLEKRTLIQVRLDYGKSNKIFVLRHPLMAGFWPGENWPDDRDRDGYGGVSLRDLGPRPEKNHAPEPGRGPDRRRVLGPDKFGAWASAQLDWSWLDCTSYVLVRVVPGPAKPKDDDIPRVRSLSADMNMIRARVLQLPEQDRLDYIGMAEQLMERRYRGTS